MNKNSRSQNTKKNIIWGTINKLIFVLLPFIIRTVLINTLGIEYVGINGLFGSILEVLSLADMGFSGAIVYSMYKPIAENNNKTVCALLEFYKNIYRVIGIIILVAGLLCLPILKYIVKDGYPVDINIYIIYVVYLINSVISYFLFAYKKSLLIAYQTKRLSDNASSIVKLVTSMLQILVLVFCKNYYVYVLLIPICTLMDNIISALIANKIYPEIKCKGSLEKDIKLSIIKRVKGLFVYKVCGVTRNSLDNIFISMFLGVTTVGIYSNYYIIMSSIRGFMDVITVSMSASIGNSVASESVEKNYIMLNIFTFLYSWICGWCTICLLCLIQPFMNIWMKSEDKMFPFSVVIALCFYFYAWTMGDIRSQYTDAVGLWHMEKGRSIVEALGNILLNYFLGKTLGVLGIVLATGISIALIGLPWSTRIVFKNYFKEGSWYKYIGKQLLYALSTMLIAFITYRICMFITYEGILELVIKSIMCIFIPNILYFLLFAKTQIAKQSFEFFKSKVLRK